MKPSPPAMRLAFSLSLALLMGSSLTQAIPLTGITEVRFDAAHASSTENNEVTFGNLRIKSGQTSFEDYIEGRYAINHTTGGLTLLDAKVYPNVGLQTSEASAGLPGHVFLAKDVPASIYMYRTPSQPQQYAMDAYHSLNSSNGPFYMSLTAGHRLTFEVAAPTDACSFVFTSPSGKEIFTFPSPALTGTTYAIIDGAVIHETGVHRIDFLPKTGNSARVRFRFLNENRRTLITAAAGTRINTTLRGDSSDYAKAKVHLRTGQTAVLTRNGSSSQVLDCFAYNSKGAKVESGIDGIELTALKEDDYYIFILSNNVFGPNVTVNMTISIRSTLGFANWASAHGVSALARNPDQDADGDGVLNLQEYAFGSSPVSPRSVPDMPYRVQNNQLRMNYTIPSYVEGVTVRPETASGNLRTWTQATPSSQTAVPNGTRYEFMSSGSGTGKFLRVRVNQN